VMAEQRTAVPGEEVWAGIGWTQEPRSGRGLFVEHEGSTRDGVESDLSSSLISIAEAREVEFGPHHARVVGARCQGTPVCALMLAVYEAEPWSGSASGAGGRPS